MPNTHQTIRFVMIAGVMPVFFSYFAYFLSVSDLTGSVFSPDEFAAIYDQGVFQYRVLGIYLLRLVVEAITLFGLPETAPKFMTEIYPNTVTEWFSAFFYLNLMGLWAAMAGFFLVFEKFRQGSSPFLMDMTLMVILLLLMISQYVIVPYDMLSYLFLAIAMYFIFHRPNDVLTVAVLCVTVAVATLTRETSALILSLYAAVHFGKLFQWPPRRQGEWHYMVTLVLITLSFVIIYVLLRLLIESDQPFYAKVRTNWNFVARMSLVGFFFFWAWAAFALIYREARSTVALFLLASSPYIVAISVIANPREIRLWMPMLIIMIALQYRGACTKPHQ